MDLQGRRWRSPRWGTDRAMPHDQVAHSDVPPDYVPPIGQRSTSDDNYFGIDSQICSNGFNFFLAEPVELLLGTTQFKEQFAL